MAEKEKIVADEMSEERKTALANLAKSQLGPKFTGEVPKAEEPEEAPEEELEEKPEEETEPEEVEQEEAEEAPEEEEVQTLDQLAEQLGWEDDTLKSLKVRRKVNGQETEVTVAELLETNQTAEAAKEELRQAKEIKARADEEIAKAKQALNEQMGIAARLIEEEKKSLQRRKEAVNWESLKADDPATYAVKRAEFEDEERALEGRLAAARQDYQKNQLELSEQNKEKFNEYVKAQGEALVRAMPEWKDEATYTKEGQEIGAYLLKHPSGFTEQEIKQAFDHRFWVFAKKAYLYDKQQAEAPAKKKKIAAIPKTMKPGAAKSADHLRTKKIKDAKDLLAKKPTAASALELLKAQRAARE